MKTSPHSLRTIGWRSTTALVLALIVAGCASPRHRAPVEDRAVGVRPTTATEAPPAGTTAMTESPAPAVPEPPKVPTYVVKPGDTLIRIGLETGQNWRDIMRWNGLDNANVLEVGQQLRVGPPPAEAMAAGPRPVAPAGRVDAKPLEAAAPVAAAAPTPVPPVAAAPTTPAPAPAPAAATASAGSKDPDEDVNWMWPASGPLLAGFDEARNKGLGIGGKAGDPVLAAADGRVVYAGSGLRGYGNLVIVKHNATYLTAYAHNQTLLVKEDQIVRRGQKIAEMGSTDADRVKLHFEIRRQGKPIDPAQRLPPR